mmetsp:Transcript_22031/g.27801  ORF Transcript_22031/g.27801 Transcript_22031/m.27801 type:complete len:409 (-) Transcript_22031:106-1332(-)
MKGNDKIVKRTLRNGVTAVAALLLLCVSTLTWTKRSHVVDNDMKQLLGETNTVRDGLEDERAAHLSLSSISSRQFELASETEGCKRLSKFGMNQAQLRIFIYQKKGGEQLVNILIHYLQAMTYDEIVIIANEEDDGTDLLATNPLYEKIVSKGMHFWQCEGTLQVKGQRWTEVISQYQNKTDFVLPIDADEYLSIALPKSGDDVSNSKAPLVWDRTTLLTALEDLPASNGKPYKTLDAKPLPVDCEDHPDGIIPDIEGRHSPRHCNIPGISKGQLGCFAKNIFAGEDFTSVDNGNHHGPKLKTREWRVSCETKGLESAYIPSNFVLIHYQVLDFSDWLIHLLKRVVDYKYELDCDKPNPNWPPFHVCNAHAKAKAANFSVHAMQKIYGEMFCKMRATYDTTGITTFAC